MLSIGPYHIELLLKKESQIRDCSDRMHGRKLCVSFLYFLPIISEGRQRLFCMRFLRCVYKRRIIKKQNLCVLPLSYLFFTSAIAV